jgi:hypothetical protein
MTKSFREIAADLTVGGPLRPAASPSGPVAKKKRPSSAEIEEMLLRFLKGDEEGSASRLAAAKILLERLSATSDRDDDAKKREREEREGAEAEAQAVLAELAAAKLAGVSGAGQVDTHGAPLAIDAAGTAGQ